MDVLVNNAGVSYRAVAEHVTEAERLSQLDANFLGPMELIRLVLPHMREQRYGRIINVSSVGGMTAMPTMSIYSASKFALEGASESLWYEMRPFGVSVSLVRPGFINSDGFRKVRFTAQGQRALADPNDPYHAHYVNMDELIAGLMTLTFYTPRDVAETILEVIEQKNPPLWVAGTLDAQLFDFLRRIIPSGLYHRLLYAACPAFGAGAKAGIQPSAACGRKNSRASGSASQEPADRQRTASSKLELATDFRCWQRAAQSTRFSAAAEQDHGGDATNVEALGDRWQRFRVDFGDEHALRALPARASPFRARPCGRGHTKPPKSRPAPAAVNHGRARRNPARWRAGSGAPRQQRGLTLRALGFVEQALGR